MRSRHFSPGLEVLKESGALIIINSHIMEHSMLQSNMESEQCSVGALIVSTGIVGP